MSYPYDAPSISISTIWNSGSYKPTDITRTIRDNYTPINKNSMTNSVGQEISLLQNFVNSQYLGRSDVPVKSGFLTNVLINSGEAYGLTYGLTIGNEDGNGGNVFIKTNGGMGIQLTGDNVTTDRITGLGSNLIISKTGGTSLDLNDSYVEINNSGFIGHSLQVGGLIDDTLAAGDFIAQSGKFVNNLRVDGQIIINSGAAYAQEYGLTVGNENGNTGNAYIKTYGGGGIEIKGDNGITDRIVSTASQDFVIGIGSTSLSLHTSGVMGLPADATSTQTSYDLVNAIKALLIERGLATAI